MGKKFSHLSYEQRCKIRDMIENETPIATISNILGVCRETIYNEINRGKFNGIYDPEYAEEKYRAGLLKRGRESILSIDKKLAYIIADYILKDHLSPRDIVRLLQKRSDEFAEIPSRNTIYNAIDSGLIPNVTRKDLRNKETKVFNNGTICLATWVREELGINDGDILQFDITEEGKIIFFK